MPLSDLETWRWKSTTTYVHILMDTGRAAALLEQDRSATPYSTISMDGSISRDRPFSGRPAGHGRRRSALKHCHAAMWRRHLPTREPTSLMEVGDGPLPIQTASPLHRSVGRYKQGGCHPIQILVRISISMRCWLETR
jgi:hypothetical protein